MSVCASVAEYLVLFLFVGYFLCGCPFFSVRLTQHSTAELCAEEQTNSNSMKNYESAANDSKSNVFSPFVAELYFLISKFLANGPLQETAKVGKIKSYGICPTVREHQLTNFHSVCCRFWPRNWSI